MIPRLHTLDGVLVMLWGRAHAVGLHATRVSGGGVRAGGPYRGTLLKQGGGPGIRRRRVT